MECMIIGHTTLQLSKKCCAAKFTTVASAFESPYVYSIFPFACYSHSFLVQLNCPDFFIHKLIERMKCLSTLTSINQSEKVLGEVLDSTPITGLLRFEY